jgi:4-aminobutyrate aminotransferase
LSNDFQHPSLSPELGAAAEGDQNLSLRRAEWQATQLGPATMELLERDKAVFLKQSLSTPCLNAIKSARGSWIEDLEGRRYLDFHGNSVHQIGYGHPKVLAAMHAALETLPFSPRRYTNELSVRLAEKLVELAPKAPGSTGKLNKVLFTPSGTGAVGIALKLARYATGRFKTLSMWDSFHGASLDAISIGGEDLFRRNVGPLLPGSEHVSPPDPIRCPLGCGLQCDQTCASYLEYVLDKEGDIGAVVAEPFRCTTAVAPPPGYWERIREACTRNGTLLIFDEIPLCLGRTGLMFATEHTGVEPDILILGKGLGGGIFPLAAVLASEDLDVADEFAVGHYTHEKSPVGAAAGLATLEAIEDENMLQACRESGQWLVQELGKFTHPDIIEVRGHGLLVGVELAYPALAEAILYDCLSEGLSFKVSSGTVLTLTPPINISRDDLKTSVEILRRAFDRAEAS